MVGVDVAFVLVVLLWYGSYDFCVSHSVNKSILKIVVEVFLMDLFFERRGRRVWESAPREREPTARVSHHPNKDMHSTDHYFIVCHSVLF
jgi:hypothetical protein